MEKTTIVIILIVVVAAAFFFIPQLDGKGSELPPILGVVSPDLEDVPTNIPCNTNQDCVDYAINQGAKEEDVLTKCIEQKCVYTVDLTLPEGVWEVTE